MGGTPVPTTTERGGPPDDFPTGQTIRAAREAAGWSIVEAARKLKQRSARPLPALDSLVRSWKRWEKETTPSLPYRPDLAELLQLDYGPAGGGGPEPVAEILQAYPNQTAAAGEIRTLAAEATTIDVLAVRGLGILALNDSLLRQSMTQRHRPLRLRVLLLRPHSEAVRRRADEVGEPPASLSAGIVMAQNRLREVADLPRVTVESYEYDTLPVWRIVRLDGTLFVSTVTAQWEGHESRCYKLVATQNGPLYQGFERTFDELLDQSTRVI